MISAAENPTQSILPVPLTGDSEMFNPGPVITPLVGGIDDCILITTGPVRSRVYSLSNMHAKRCH